jgi:hypothetical protein
MLIYAPVVEHPNPPPNGDNVPTCPKVGVMHIACNASLIGVVDVVVVRVIEMGSV